MHSSSNVTCWRSSSVRESWAILMAGSSPGASCHSTAARGFLTAGGYTSGSGFLRLEPFAFLRPGFTDPLSSVRDEVSLDFDPMTCQVFAKPGRSDENLAGLC